MAHWEKAFITSSRSPGVQSAVYVALSALHEGVTFTLLNTFVPSAMEVCGKRFAYSLKKPALLALCEDMPALQTNSVRITAEFVSSFTKMVRPLVSDIMWRVPMLFSRGTETAL